MFRRGVMPCVKAKLVCALLLECYHSIIGYGVICLLWEVWYWIGWVSAEWKSIGIRGTRKVPVPGNGEPNIQGTRTVPVPGSGEPNIQGTRMEPFRYPSVR